MPTEAEMLDHEKDFKEKMNQTKPLVNTLLMELSSLFTDNPAEEISDTVCSVDMKPEESIEYIRAISLISSNMAFQALLMASQLEKETGFKAYELIEKGITNHWMNAISDARQKHTEIDNEQT